ncbi:MAG: NAD(P)/FAD-dependent oxidoreductase [Acidimicrobiales bacterium]
MISIETVVVGAGPAGASAAHVLATAGREVALVDKASFPRDKFCGDGLTTLALRELDELGFDPSTVSSWTPIDGAIIRSPKGRVHELGLPSGRGQYAAIARRSDLDAALVDHARAAGALVRFGNGVVSMDPSSRDQHVELTLADGEVIRARQCIAADGMWSPIRKMQGLDMPGYRGEWHAFRQYFENVGPNAASELWVWFEPDILPGYFWSFPIGDGRANVGFGILRGGRLSTQDMKRLWPNLLARDHIRDILGADAKPESPHRAWPIPARIDKAPLSGEFTLFAGDAAAACDPLTGEGIGQALLTGRLAAQAVIDRAGVDDGSFEAVERQYVAEVQSELLADHRMAVALGKLLESPRVAEFALKAVGANPWTRRNFGRWMFEDYPRALVATPRRWHRGALTKPGAFAADSAAAD